MGTIRGMNMHSTQHSTQDSLNTAARLLLALLLALGLAACAASGPAGGGGGFPSGTGTGSGPSGSGSSGSSSGGTSGTGGSGSSGGGFPGGSGGLPGGFPGGSAGLPGGMPGGSAGLPGGRGNSGRGNDGDHTLDTLPGGANPGAAGSGGSNNPGNPTGSDRGGQPGSSGQPGGTGQPGGIGQGGQGRGNRPLTAEERAAILDERLRRGYEVFDGEILEEQRRVQTENNSDRAGGTLGDGTYPGGNAEGGSNDMGGATASAGQQPQTMPADSGERGSSGNAPEVTYPPPDDIPSGRNDDVVARQLREAAMREPDPELREKLWEEYRQYTGISDN